MSESEEDSMLFSPLIISIAFIIVFFGGMFVSSFGMISDNNLLVFAGSLVGVVALIFLFESIE